MTLAFSLTAFSQENDSLRELNGIKIDYGENGNLTLDINAENYSTLEEVVAEFAEKMGGTAEAWESVITLFSNYDPTFLKEWNEEQYGQVPKRLKESAF